MQRRKAVGESTTLRRAGLMIIFALIVAALYYGSSIFIPLALSLLLTFVLWPVADWLERHRFPRSAAAVLVVAVVCALTLTLSYVVGDQIVQFARDLPNYRNEIVRKANTLKGTGVGLRGTLTQTIGEIQHDIKNGATTAPTTRAADPRSAGASTSPPVIAATEPTASPEKLTERALNEAAVATSGQKATSQPAVLGASPSNPLFVSSADNSAMGQLASYAGIVLGPIGTVGLVLVLVLFMLLEREDLRDRFIRLSSGGRYTLTTQALTDATTRIGRYLRAQLIVNGTYGIAIAIGLWIIGLIFGNGVTFPNFILWGVLCAVLRFIPYVGPWVAAAFPLVVSLAVYEGFGAFFAVAGMFVTVELLSNNFMEPVLYGSSTGISTVALLIAAIVWTSLWGPYGLLLSTPLTVCLVVLGKHVPQLNFLDVLLGDTPALPAGVRFYQRLLAGDQLEAAAVTREYAAERGQTAAADDVVLHAVRLARQDRRHDDLTAQDEADLYTAASETVAEAREKIMSDLRAKTKDDSGGTAVKEPGPDTRPLVIGLPGHHRSEAIAVDLLAGLIEPIGVRTETLTCSLLPADVEEIVARERPAAVFIAVLPPGGVAQARYVCRRLRRQFKDLPIIVGYFGTYRDYDALLVRFRAAGATYVTTSLGQSRTQVISLLKLKVDPELERLQVGPQFDELAHGSETGARPAENVQLCSPAVGAQTGTAR